jgi:hypothetical protein
VRAPHNGGSLGIAPVRHDKYPSFKVFEDEAQCRRRGGHDQQQLASINLKSTE